MPGVKKSKKSKKTKDPEEVLRRVKRTELIQRIIQLKQKTTKEEEDTKYFQGRLEKIQLFWNIAKENLELSQQEYNKKKNEIHQIQTNHELHLYSIKDQIKQILFQQQNKVIEKRNDNQIQLHMLRNKFKCNRLNQQSNKEECVTYLQGMETSHRNFLIESRLEYDRRSHLLREQYKTKMFEMSMFWDRRMKDKKAEYEIKTKKEICELEGKLEEQTNEIRKKHEEELNHLRNKYNTKIHKKLDLVEQLKKELSTKQKELRKIEKYLQEVKVQNRNIIEPLNKARIEMKQLNVDYEGMQKQKKILNECKGALASTEDGLKKLQWRHEILYQRYEALGKECSEFRIQAEKVRLKSQQRMSLHGIVFEKYMDELCRVCDGHLDKIKLCLPESSQDLVNKLKHTSTFGNTLDDLRERIQQIKEIHAILLGLKGGGPDRVYKVGITGKPLLVQ